MYVKVSFQKKNEGHSDNLRLTIKNIGPVLIHI